LFENTGMNAVKKLFIFRHGKSSWDSVVDDIDRPLTERGVSDSYEMAKRMVERGEVPERILSSPANRALHTAVIMSRIWNLPEEAINLRADLYLPEIKDIHHVVLDVPDSVDAVAIFGHNPAFTEFANMYLSDKVDNIPTAGVVILAFASDTWRTIQSATVQTEYFDFPKRKH
jgi:phosphohistidine phosphatase